MSEVDASGPRLRQLLDGLGLGVLVYDVDGRLVDHNACVRELLALDEAGVARLSFAGDVVGPHPIPPLPRLWPAVVRGEHKRAGFRALGPAGAALELEVRARSITLAGTPVVLAELHDITTYTQHEKALTDSKKLLENAVLVRTRELQAKIRLIEQQRKSLLELWTPVIQVWDGVLVLPLIGEIGGDRAAQITESVLSSIARTASRHVIIDLTGVPELDEASSEAMLRMTQAIRLLGATCSLTGMSARIAASLVHHDVAWTRSVRMFADLQAGLKAVVASVLT
jgi:rsbT co-antagonist protein RsbR